MREVVQAVSDGLPDLSVSRPVERLTWGIPVPDDETQTIYVWLDALVNYLTKSNYPFQIPGEEDAAGWPADVQVIGKDIVRYIRSHPNLHSTLLTSLKVPLRVLASFPPCIGHSPTTSSSDSRTLDSWPTEDGQINRQRCQPFLRSRAFRSRRYAILSRA